MKPGLYFVKTQQGKIELLKYKPDGVTSGWLCFGGYFGPPPPAEVLAGPFDAEYLLNVHEQNEERE